MFKGVLNRRVVITVFVVFFLVLIGAVVVTFANTDKAGKEEPRLQSSSQSKQSDLNDTDIYIVKEYDGKVAVYNNNMDKPVKTTDSSVASLPEADRAMLKKGIRVNDREELRRLLEDYCS